MRISPRDYQAMVKKIGRGATASPTNGKGSAVQPSTRRSLAEARSTFDSVAPGALGNPAPSPKSASDEENAYGEELYLQKRAEIILDYLQHPFTIPLQGKRSHRPDFIVINLGLGVEIHNYKGYHKNFRASLNVIKECAARFPWWTWVIVQKRGRRYRSTVVNLNGR